MAIPVIIDADPGIGDALAILLAALDPRLDLIGLTGTSGRVSGKIATRNLHAIVQCADLPKWPRIGSAESAIDPVFDAPWSQRQAAMNGPTGLADFNVPDVELHHRQTMKKVLVDLIRQFPKEVTLICLGPLTNVARTAETSPDLLADVKQIVCLAGTFEVPGDITATAEFNAFADPEALAFLLSRGAPLTMIPLDTSARCQLTPQQISSLSPERFSSAATLWNRLMTFSVRAHHEQLGMEGVVWPEVAAITAVTRPDLFERHTFPMAVETTGQLTRGMTIFDRRHKPEQAPRVDILLHPHLAEIGDDVRCILHAAS